VRVQRHAPPRPLFTPRKNPVPILQEAEWAPGPVCTGAENLAPPRFDPRTFQPVACRLYIREYVYIVLLRILFAFCFKFILYFTYFLYFQYSVHHFHFICFFRLLYFIYKFSFLNFLLSVLSFFFSPIFFSSFLHNFHSVLLSSPPCTIALNFYFFLGSFLFFLKDLLFISDRRIKKIFNCSSSLSTIGLIQHSVSPFHCVLNLTLYREVTSFKVALNCHWKSFRLFLFIDHS
jgi:hypothetical protein